MDDLKFGTKNKRGDFMPKEHLKIAPYFEFPPSPLKLLAFLKAYLLPWNVMYMVIALVFWFYLTPSAETTKTLAPAWIALIFLRNAALVFVVYGLLELRLYMQKRQGNRFKYFLPISPVMCSCSRARTLTTSSEHLRQVCPSGQLGRRSDFGVLPMVGGLGRRLVNILTGWRYWRSCFRYGTSFTSIVFTALFIFRFSISTFIRYITIQLTPAPGRHCPCTRSNIFCIGRIHSFTLCCHRIHWYSCMAYKSRARAQLLAISDLIKSKWAKIQA